MKTSCILDVLDWPKFLWLGPAWANTCFICTVIIKYIYAFITPQCLRTFTCERAINYLFDIVDTGRQTEKSMMVEIKGHCGMAKHLMHDL